MASGEDPTVDLVIGLERRGVGLWIPNTEDDRWDPSHPEKHTEMLTAEPKPLRVTRARAIRLAKAENKRSTPPMCSFNVETFGLMFVIHGVNEAEALLSMWQRGARDLASRFTPDPAGVSAPIKVVDREYAVARLAFAAGRLRAALDNDHDEQIVRNNLKQLWPDFVAPTATGTTKARVAAHLKSGHPMRMTSSGALAVTAGSPLKSPRSFGHG
jgi:hypothetical protein